VGRGLSNFLLSATSVSFYDPSYYSTGQYTYYICLHDGLPSLTSWLPSKAKTFAVLDVCGGHHVWKVEHVPSREL
jgi:hypothetical protein